MNAKAIELYLYMGSHEPVIKWLKEQGATTRDQAKNILTPLVGNLITSAVSMGGSLAGTANGAKRVLDAFPEK